MNPMLRTFFCWTFRTNDPPVVEPDWRRCIYPPLASCPYCRLQMSAKIKIHTRYRKAVKRHRQVRSSHGENEAEIFIIAILGKGNFLVGLHNTSAQFLNLPRKKRYVYRPM